MGWGPRGRRQAAPRSPPSPQSYISESPHPVPGSSARGSGRQARGNKIGGPASMDWASSEGNRRCRCPPPHRSSPRRSPAGRGVGSGLGVAERTWRDADRAEAAGSRLLQRPRGPQLQWRRRRPGAPSSPDAGRLSSPLPAPRRPGHVTAPTGPARAPAGPDCGAAPSPGKGPLGAGPAAESRSLGSAFISYLRVFEKREAVLAGPDPAVGRMAGTPGPERAPGWKRVLTSPKCAPRL